MTSTANSRKPHSSPERDPQRVLELVQTALEDRKGRDIQALDIAERSGFADYFVIATGTSARHVSAMAQHLHEQAKRAGYQPARAEGSESGDWVLLDLGDVVVHIMRPETRAFYNLEELWTDVLSGPDNSGAGPAADG